MNDNSDKLERVANVLMEKEKISGEEFESVFNGVTNEKNTDEQELMTDNEPI